MTTPIVRFAPSPTGHLHLGNARVAVVNWLFARRHGGRFAAADRRHRPRALARSAFEPAIREDLTWLGLGWDAEFRQSSRVARLRGGVCAAARRPAGSIACYETAGGAGSHAPGRSRRGQPPATTGGRCGWTAAERQALEAQGGARTGACSWPRASSPSTIWSWGRAASPPRISRPGAAARGRQRHLPVRLGGRRCRARHQPRHPRRGPCQQHGAAAGDPRRRWAGRRRSSPICR